MNPSEVFVRIVLYFTIFAVMGYLVEAVNSLLHEGKLSNRGFLFGPYLPIYGFGALVMIGLWRNIPHDNFFLTFFVAMMIGVVLEYATSYILEKIFHLRWWDYSKSDKFNLNGRICLRNSIIFGLGGCFFCYVLLPAINNMIKEVPNWILIVIAIVMTVVYLIDFAASSYANMKVKNMEEFSKAIGDQTKEIKKNAKKAIKTLLGNQRKRGKRH